MLTKNFSTQTVEGSSCWFRRDYSYRTNPTTCLGCEFCYKHATGDPERRRSARYIDTNEKFHSKTIFKTPVIISRFCEPFTDGHSTEASISVAEKCIENNCQFIFKTASYVPDNAKELLVNNKDNSQLQVRFISDCSVAGMATLDAMCKFEFPLNLIFRAKELINTGVDVAAIFDPFIIGVNDTYCKNLIKDLAEQGFKKLIIKQLFATDYFLRYLKLRIDRKYTKLLSVNTSGFWTYDNISFLRYLYPIVQECDKYGISISVCSNRHVNELVYGNKNCCQFKSPIGFYNKEGNIIDG